MDREGDRNRKETEREGEKETDLQAGMKMSEERSINERFLLKSKEKRERPLAL